MKPRPPIPPGPYLVVGLARSGIAAARALRARAEEVVGVDSAAPATADALRRDGLEVFTQADEVPDLLDRARAVIKSPGVPAQAPLIAAARERGLPVLGELELAWRLLDNELVAVTGTNGKTTTVELIGHVYRQAGLPVTVAGNVGTALSSLVGTLAPDATVVCEASSFQLEDTLAFSPEAAVLLNVAPDHLDRHGTVEAYAAAKLALFAHQAQGDIAVVPADAREQLVAAGAPEAARALSGAIAPGVARVEFGAGDEVALRMGDGWLHWRGERLLALAELGMRGAHNAQNAMAAAAVCLARGIDADAVRAGLRTFAGVAHRLEEVGVREGVLYVNDSKATNVASTLVALDAFAGRPIQLIVGGQGKGQDFTALRAPIERSCAAVYAIGEDGPEIARALAGIGVRVSEERDVEHALLAARSALRAGAPGLVPGGAGIEDAVRVGLAAAGAASRGPVVLLSPACASFDQFADFEARGARFRELVEKLQG